MTTGKVKLYAQAAAGIARRFESTQSFVFDCLRHSGVVCLRRDGERYKAEANKHLECEVFKEKIYLKYGYRLTKMPARCRHLLPENRR